MLRPMNGSQNNIGLGLLMPLLGHLTCYVRQQASVIYRQLGYDLTPEAADALLIIHHFDGLPQKKLADILGKDKAAVTRLLNTLVKSQLVERIQDTDDRRVIRAHITEEGREAFSKIHPELGQLSKSILSPLSQQQFDAVIQSLSDIVSNLPCQPSTKSDKT